MKLEIGSRLKRLRMEKSLTQKELAVMVSGGLDYTYIGKIERGEQLPSLKILLKISDALSVPVASFFQDQSAPASSSLPADSGYPAGTETGRQLLKALKSVDEDDLPLVIEIIRVLGRHRKAAKKAQSEYAEEQSPDWSMAAETMIRYKKDPK